MVVRFIDKYLSVDLAGSLLQDLAFSRLLPDPVTGDLVWDAGGKYELLGKISGDIDNSGNPLNSLLINLAIQNLPSSARGMLIVDNSGVTQYSVSKLTSEASQWEGNYGVLVDSKNILEFVYENKVLSWRSYTNPISSTLATFENGIVVFKVDSNVGIDDSNHLTPYLTIEHAWREMIDKIPRSKIFPSPGGGFSNDRIRSVRFELTGTFNEAISLHFNNDYAIEIVGMGATPADTIIFGDSGEAALSLTSTNEISIQNLTINSDFMCINLIGSQMVKVDSCNFIVRSVETPRNIFFAVKNSSITIVGQVQISGNIRRFLNCTDYSSSKVNCAISSPADAPITFTESFLFASKYSLIDALSASSSISLNGVAVEVDDIVTTVLLPTPFSDLS